MRTRSLTRSLGQTMAVAALAAGAAGLSTTTADASAPPPESTYQITFTNLTGGQWLTPPNVAAHAPAADVFQVGSPASPGVRAVAENGDVPALAAELAAALDAAGAGVSTVGGDGPIAPGDAISFEITALRGDRQLSIVSMIICTNDGFGGLDGRPLPSRVGAIRTYAVNAFDAGTELNTEADADIVRAPFCLTPEVGTGVSNPELAEGGVIAPHDGIGGVGDLDASYDWAGPVASVTVERIG